MQRIGNYQLVTQRGSDVSGTVYEAKHIVLPRRAIVKVVDAGEPRARAIQLLREACILEALEHAGIVRVYESGLLPDRRAWFAHELVEGATVEDMFASGPLAPADAVALLRDIAEVLEHSHRRGVVHCGLRPDSIVVTGRSRGFPLCVVDWSDARAHDTTSRGPVPALREYVAPELVRDQTIDDRIDMFSLGVIAYQALTGVLPFDGVTKAKDTDGAAQHVPTTVRCPDAPPELATLVDQMLATDRWDRPSSAEARAELAVLATELAEPAPASSMRIRKPRWTPQVPFVDADTDITILGVGPDKPERNA